MNIKHNILYAVTSGFILGIFVSSFVKVNQMIVAVVFVISVGLLATLVIRKNFREEKTFRNLGILFFIGVTFFTVGVFRMNYFEDFYSDSVLFSYEGQNISAIGLVSNEPQRKDNIHVFELEVFAFDVDGKIVEVRPEKIVLKTPFYNDVVYGNQVIVKGKLEKITNFSNQTGSTFDYVSYMKKDGVLFEIRYPEIQVISGGHGNPAVSLLLELKDNFIKNINSNLDEPDSSLVAGMIISGKQALDRSATDDFVKTGIIHIVVLSGYNISIIIVSILTVFHFLKRKIRFGIVALIILCFVVMSGGSSTVLRASVMAVIALWAKYSNRPASGGRLLILTAFILIFWNPYLLAFDPSFELSFLATIAIIFVSPVVREKSSWITTRFKLREIFSETLGVQMFLLPFLVYKMGLVSIVALPVNILVLPVIPILMLLGVIIGFAGFVPLIVFPFALMCNIFVSHILFVVKLFSSLPFSTVSINSFPLSAMVGIYIIFAAYFVYLSYQKKKIYLEPTRSL